jgi:hypothetical protein
MLEEDWPGLFREHLLEELPVDQMLPHFTDGIGRPSKELYTVLGVLLLQQTMDLTDKAAIEQLAFNIQWHYALNVLSTPLLMVFRAINFHLYGLTNTSGLTPIACKNSN